MELQHLVRSGHNFLDKKLQVVLEEYFALVRDAHDDNLRMQDLNATFVACMGTTIGGEQKFETVRVTKVNERYYTRVDDSTRKHYIGTSEIPEDVRGKVSVLSMIPHGQFVNGVGMRVCDTLVYVTTSTRSRNKSYRYTYTIQDVCVCWCSCYYTDSGISNWQLFWMKSIT